MGVFLEQHEAEQHRLQLMRAFRAKEYTLAAAAAELNALGIRNRFGRGWSHQWCQCF